MDGKNRVVRPHRERVDDSVDRCRASLHELSHSAQERLKWWQIVEELGGQIPMGVEPKVRMMMMTVYNVAYVWRDAGLRCQSHSDCCCCLVRRSLPCQSRESFTSCWLVTRIYRGRSASPRIWNRCLVVAGHFCNHCSSVWDAKWHLRQRGSAVGWRWISGQFMTVATAAAACAPPMSSFCDTHAADEQVSKFHAITSLSSSRQRAISRAHQLQQSQIVFAVVVRRFCVHV